MLCVGYCPSIRSHLSRLRLSFVADRPLDPLLLPSDPCESALRCPLPGRQVQSHSYGSLVSLAASHAYILLPATVSHRLQSHFEISLPRAHRYSTPHHRSGSRWFLLLCSYPSSFRSCGFIFHPLPLPSSFSISAHLLIVKSIPHCLAALRFIPPTSFVSPDPQHVGCPSFWYFCTEIYRGPEP